MVNGFHDASNAALALSGLVRQKQPIANGVPPARREFVHRVRALTSELDIPLVVGEVQTGCDRTGTWFAFGWEPGAHTGTFRGNQAAFAAGAETVRIVRLHGAQLERRLSVLRGRPRAARSGPDFDKVWLLDQLAAHVSAIALTDRETRQGWSPEVKDLAARSAPVLRHHLEEVVSALEACP